MLPLEQTTEITKNHKRNFKNLLLGMEHDYNFSTQEGS